MFNHTVIDPFVVPTNDDQMRVFRKLCSRLLIKPMSSGRHQHHLRCVGSEIFHRRKNGLRLHHHSLAAAERCIVYDVMLISRPLSQIMDLKIDNPIFLGALHDAFAKRRPADIGKQSQDVDLHSGRKVGRPAVNVQSEMEIYSTISRIAR